MITNLEIIRRLEEKTKSNPEMRNALMKCLEIESEGSRPHYTKKYEQIIKMAINERHLKEGNTINEN